MNEYEIDTADYVEDRRTHVTDLVKQTRRVQAHSAADALTCFERNHPGETITGIRCVERAATLPYWPPTPFRDPMTWAMPCLVCGSLEHGNGTACPVLVPR